MRKEQLTEYTTFWNLYFTRQKEVECVFTFLCFIRKCSGKKFLAFIFSSFVFMTSVFFLSIPNVHSLDIKLQWNKNTETDIAGYRIFCREEDENYYNYNKPIWEGTDTTCTISGLVENKAYFFVARAFNTRGMESKNSNERIYFSLKDSSIKESDPFINNSNELFDKISNVFYTNQGQQTLDSMEYEKLKIKIYNKYTGKWLSYYKFFQKTCGKKTQFYDNENIFYVKDGNELTRYLR